MNTGSFSFPVRRFVSGGTWLAACALATAASAAPGDVLWERTVDGSLGVSDSADAIDARDGRVFAAGAIRSSQPAALAVRAYAANNGRLLWSAQPPTGSNDEAHGVHAFANVVAVCALFEFEGRAVFGVVAYEVDTGREVWLDTGTNGDARACDGQQGTLYVVGSDFDGVGGADVLVRAYHARTGVVLWQDRFDGGGNVGDAANAVDIQDGDVYVTGVIQQTPGDEDLFVRRYDGASGALVWQQIHAGPGGGRDEGAAISVTANRVFVGGFASQAGPANGSAVIALRTDTGARLWADFHEGEIVHAIAARAGHVIAAAGPQVEETNAIVRAYDARSGALAWARSEGVGGGAALALDTDDQYAYWGAVLRVSNSESEQLVQAVHIETGETAWEDVRENARPAALVVDDRRLFVAGATEEAGGLADFLVRALRAR
jgi:hypothetical protein